MYVCGNNKKLLHNINGKKREKGKTKKQQGKKTQQTNVGCNIKMHTYNINAGTFSLTKT